MQSLFEDVTVKIDDENEVIVERLDAMECQVAEHAELIEIECM